jgi:hypothetical protein
MFSGKDKTVQVMHHVLEVKGLLNFAQSESGFDVQLDGENEAGTAEATDGSQEEILVFVTRTGDARPVGKK